MLPKYEHSFEGVIVPGMYVLKFDLLLESQLDNFYVQLVINNSFPSLRKKTLYSRNYTIENANKTAYMCIQDDYLVVQSIDYVEETTDFVLDSYLLFDENNETVYPSSFIKKDVIMYALENPSDLEEPSKLHMYDCLRANKSLAAWGIEGRVPFLDKEFMDVAMRINPQDKMINGERMEKWVVRKAFEDMLPASVAWRQKEQFSDGVGYNWIDSLKAMVNEKVTDEMMNTARHFKSSPMKQYTLSSMKVKYSIPAMS